MPRGKWPMIPLHDVASIDRSSLQASAIIAGTLYVGLEHIASNGTFLDPKPVDAGALASSKFRFTDRHILYGKLRPYLAKIASPDFEGICSTDIVPILPGPKIDRRYLFHYLRQPSMIQYASSRTAGVNLPRLSPSTLASFEIPLPPLPEQRRIATILDKAASLRAKRYAAQMQLGALTPSIFLDMFGDPAKNSQGWERNLLGDLTMLGPQNGLYKPATDYGSGTPILRIDGFYDGEVSDLRMLKRLRASSEEIDLFGLREEDIVINRVNSREFLGKSALIPALTEPTVFESNMMRIRVDTARISPGYLIQYLQTAFVRSQVHRAAKDAVNQSSINQQDVKQLEVLLPPIELQEQFVKRVRKIRRVQTCGALALRELDALFASLQHRAFRGQL